MGILKPARRIGCGHWEVSEMKIYFASDHGGFETKEELKRYAAEELGHEVEDCGAHQLDPADNYPDYIVPAAKKIAADPEARGVIAGGSGQGEAMAANKVKGIRAFVYYGPAKAVKAVDVSGRMSEDPHEIVKLARLHNNSNVISFGNRFVPIEEAKQVLKLWLETPFEGGRHQKRIELMDQLS